MPRIEEEAEGTDSVVLNSKDLQLVWQKNFDLKHSIETEEGHSMRKVMLRLMDYTMDVREGSMYQHG